MSENENEISHLPQFANMLERIGKDAVTMEITSEKQLESIKTLVINCRRVTEFIAEVLLLASKRQPVQRYPERFNGLLNCKAEVEQFNESVWVPVEEEMTTESFNPDNFYSEFNEKLIKLANFLSHVYATLFGCFYEM